MPCEYSVSKQSQPRNCVLGLTSLSARSIVCWYFPTKTVDFEKQKLSTGLLRSDYTAVQHVV